MQSLPSIYRNQSLTDQVKISLFFDIQNQNMLFDSVLISISRMISIHFMYSF